MSRYEPRAIVKAIDPRNCDPVEVICAASKINETLAAALASGHAVRSVTEFWSIDEEEQAFLAACPEEAEFAGVFG